jgi:branched-chain amino acid transport system permease protein
MGVSVAGQLLVNAGTIAGIYVLMGVGLSLIYRVSGVFHFAHGVIYTLGAYVFFALMVQLGVPLLLALLLAVGVAAGVGHGIDRAVYQPLGKQRASGATLLIASLGVYILLENLVALFYGSDTQILLPGVQTTLSLAGATVTWTQIAKIGLFFAVVVAAFWLRRRPIGLWLRSVAGDGTMALALGLSVTRIRATAFLVGSALAGLAGCMAALDSGAEPHMGMKALFVGIVAVFVGGPDIFLAPIVGGLFFAILQVGATYTLSSRWESTVAFVVLLMFMAVKPEGILGRTRRVEERVVH